MTPGHVLRAYLVRKGYRVPAGCRVHTFLDEMRGQFDRELIAFRLVEATRDWSHGEKRPSLDACRQLIQWAVAESNGQQVGDYGGHQQDDRTD